MERSMEGPQKNKNRNTIWPTSEKLPTENKITSSKNYMHSYVYYIIYNGQDMEAT